MLNLHRRCTFSTDSTRFFFSQGPFAASLGRSARRLSNHQSDVWRDRTDEGPLFGELSNKSATDTARVQHHPGGFACQRCWYLKTNQLPTSCIWPGRFLTVGTTKKNNVTFYMEEKTWTKDIFWLILKLLLHLPYIKCNEPFKICCYFYPQWWCH